MRRAPSVLLFVRQRRAATSRSAIAALMATQWPPHVRVTVIDVARRPALAEWFGVQSFPTIVVETNGAPEIIDHACDAAACNRLLDHLRVATYGTRLQRTQRERGQ